MKLNYTDDEQAITFYGISKVSHRGQIVIPKQAREDHNINHDTPLVLLIGVLPHSKEAFLLFKADLWYRMNDDAPLKKQGHYRFGSLVKITQRGQLVIPKEIREQFKIKEGDPIVILSHGKVGGIILAILTRERLKKWASSLL